MSGIDEVLTQDDLVEANRILSLIPILRTRVERILVEMNGEPCTNNLENHVEWNIHQNILSYYLESFHERLKDTIDELTRISRRFNNNIQIEF